MTRSRKASKKKSPVGWQVFLSRAWGSARLPLLMIAIALLPRLLVLFELTDSPLFYYPAIDSETYHEMAMRIAAGDLVGRTAFWQAPLYPYFLGMIYSVFGVNILAAKVIQMLMGALNCYLVFAVAVRVFNKRTGWLAYAIAVLYGPFIFFSAELMAPVLLNLLLLSTLLVLLSYGNRPRATKALVSGALLGLAQIGHGLTIAFLPIAIGWLVFIHKRKQQGLSISAKAAGYMLLGFLPLIMLTTVRNYAVDREVVLVSANFGANFYLGNHPNYDSTTAIRPGLEWDEFIQEAAVNGHKTPAQSSAYFTEKALRNIADSPSAFLGLLTKKTWLLLSGEEIKRNLDIYHFRGYSMLLKALIWRAVIAFPSGLILPLALTWILCFFMKRDSNGNRGRKWLLILFVFTQAAAMLVFFISTRYRLPMMPTAIVFAAAMMLQLIDMIRHSKIVAALPSILILCALLFFCNIPRSRADSRGIAENAFYEGLAYSRAGDYPTAIGKYEAALLSMPDYPMAEYNLALCYDRTGRHAQARELFDKIVAKHPESFVTKLVVGNAQLNRNNLREAENLFKAVLDINPNSVEALVNLGHIYRLQKDSTRALAVLRSSLVKDPKAYKAYNQIGAVYMQFGQPRLAEANFRRAYELNHSYPSALNNLAAICNMTSRTAEAREYLENALKLDPDNATTLLNLGALELKQVKPAEALRFFDRAVAVSPDMPQAHHYRGIALLSLRRTADARKSFRQALKLDPGYEPSRKELQRIGS
jgi:tetratricopeptide (TPR) repeat protein